jgi:regulator of protease activity HflC (stomatin/prohibitin superfamily)
VTSFGKVKDYTLDSGLHFKAPWYSIIKMDNRVQKKSVELSCFSSDIQEVNVKYTLNFRIEKENAMKIYREIGKDYYDTVITPAIAESVKIVTAKYSAENLVSMRTELAQGIEKDLSGKLVKYNVEVVSTAVENMDFTDAFTDAVEQKQVAEQNKLRAQTEAEQKVIEAEAEAKVKLIQAEAEAEANKVISESLTDKIIKKFLYEKWDGKMPTVTGGEGNVLIPSDMFN